MKTTKRLLWSMAIAVALIAACADPEVAKRQAFESGNRYFEQGRYGDAIVEYRNAIQRDPRFGEARAKLADAYQRIGDVQASYAEHIRAADLLPDNIEVQLRAATYLLLTGQFEDARSRVQRVLEREASNVQALVILGNALAGLRDLDGAIAQIEQAIEIDPSRAGIYANLAGLELAQGDREQARATFQKAVELGPTSVSARIAFGIFLWGIEDRAGAERSLKAALSLDGKHVLANRALANYYIAVGRAPEAEPYLKTLAAEGGAQEKIALADYYLMSRRLSEATGILDAQVREPNSSRTTAELRLAQINYAEKRTADAHATLDKVFAREPRNAAALVMKARWLQAEGKAQDALKYATAATAADPRSASAHYVLGTIQSAVSDFDAATKSFAETLRLNPRAAAAQVQLSRVTLMRGDSQAAVQFARGAVVNDPANPLARLTLARGLLAQGQTAQAETEIAALLKQYPKAASVRSTSAAIKAAKKDFGGARIEYERALDLDADAVDALSGLTALDITQKNLDRARTRVEARLAAQPNRPELLMLAARVYAAERDFGKAELTLQRLINADPANMAGYAMLGQVYMLQRKLDPAKAEFEKRIQLNPKDLPSHVMVALIYEAQNNPAEAKKKYEAVLAINGRSVIAANNLAYLYATSGENLDRALSLAQTAVAQAPDSAAVQDTLGWVYHQKQMPELAIRTFEQSIARDPGNALYHYHLGLAYAKSSDHLRAHRSLETALKLRPNYTEARQALNSISQASAR
jgi:tetratricopeptide (TPR) repeat protein